MDSPEEAPRELIIIRRGGGDDNAAVKGGAWKIAYADFVTAMMAFFLVMWLINSANEATKARVASYFNPIKMTDAAPSGRGLNSETTNKSKAQTPETSAPGGGTGKQGEDGGQGLSNSAAEEALMSEPFKALDKLASEGSGEPSGRTIEIVTQKSGDPFDPMVWDALRKGVHDEEVKGLDKELTAGEQLADSGLNSQRPEIKVQSEQDTGEVALEKKNGEDSVGVDSHPENKKQTGESGSIGKEADPNPKEKAVDSASKASTESLEAQEAIAKEEAKIAERLSAQLEGIRNNSEKLSGLSFEVKVTSEGVLVVLGDSKASSMFQIGSAEPSPPLVDFIGKIGQLLSEQSGNVIIRGHTDARRFQGRKFDNWQLSTARAHMSSYMLIRGGLPEERVLKIEGYGSTTLLDTKDPLADVNRRVEIVLVPPK